MHTGASNPSSGSGTSGANPASGSRPTAASPKPSGDCARIKVQPAALFVLTVALGFGIGRMAPLEHLNASIVQHAGIAAVAAGCLFAAWGIICLKVAGTTVKPGAPVIAFVCKGPYRISRNPMYLALLVIQLGLGMILGNWGILVTIPLLAGLLHTLSIRPEEHCMHLKFGPEYRDYCGKVRRWI